MAKKWGNVDIDGLKKLAYQIDRLQGKGSRSALGTDVQDLLEGISKELAARLLAKVVKRTPVGKYPKETGKKGGTLRRGWTARTESEARSGEGSKNVTEYVDDLVVRKNGNVYEIEIINPVNYASYVEYGHRTRGGEGWVEGQFMLTISQKELDVQSPAIIERRINAALREVFR